MLISNFILDNKNIFNKSLNLDIGGWDELEGFFLSQMIECSWFGIWNIGFFYMRSYGDFIGYKVVFLLSF